jgi:transcriptional regulator with XRE-family HTH domain
MTHHVTDKQAQSMHSDWASEVFANPKVRREYDFERPAFEFVEQVETILEEKDITRAALAARMNRSAPAITQLLRRGRNLTIKTMVEVARALNHGVHVVLHEEATDVVPTISTKPIGLTLAQRVSSWETFDDLEICLSNDFTAYFAQSTLAAPQGQQGSVPLGPLIEMNICFRDALNRDALNCTNVPLLAS